MARLVLRHDLALPSGNRRSSGGSPRDAQRWPAVNQCPSLPAPQGAHGPWPQHGYQPPRGRPRAGFCNKCATAGSKGSDTEGPDAAFRLGQSRPEMLSTVPVVMMPRCPVPTMAPGRGTAAASGARNCHALPARPALRGWKCRGATSRSGPGRPCRCGPSVCLRRAHSRAARGPRIDPIRTQMSPRGSHGPIQTVFWNSSIVSLTFEKPYRLATRVICHPFSY